MNEFKLYEHLAGQQDCLGLDDLELPGVEKLSECLVHRLSKDSPDAISLAELNELQLKHTNAIDKLWTKGGGPVARFFARNAGDAHEINPDKFSGRSLKLVLGSLGILPSNSEKAFRDSEAGRVLLERIDSLKGSRLEILENAFALVLDTFEHPDHLASGDPRLDKNKWHDLGKAISLGVGDCDPQSAILAFALERHGFKADIMSAPGHAWVRVSVPSRQGNTPLVFDLDPANVSKPYPFLPNPKSS